MLESHEELPSEKVRLEQPYFNQVLDAITDLVLVKGENSKILWANKAFREFYGMSNKQLREIIDAPFNEADNTKQYVKDDAYVFQTGKTLNIPKEKVTRYDGYVGTFHTVKSAIQDSQGKIIMTVGVSRDITAELEVQRRLEEARATYFQAAKMAVIGEMAAEVAHEVNTPLTTIQILSETLSKLVKKGKDEKEAVSEALQRIHHAVLLISKNISELKLFPKSDHEDHYIKLQIGRVIEVALSVCEERLIQNGVNLQVHYPRELPEIFGSPTLLSQVVLSLINTAHDSIFSLSEKSILVEVSLVDPFIEVSLIASGSGTPDKVDYENDPGALESSKDIVVRHGGTMAISNNSTNTKFLLQLPYV